MKQPDERNDPINTASDTSELKTDWQSVRDVLRVVPYGLYVLTAAHDSEVNAITCNWLTQISFDPLLLTVALEKDSQSHLLLVNSGVFVINFLSKDQTDLARRMAAPHRINRHKMVGAAYHTGETGVPILDESIAFLECRVTETLEVGGDHTLFIGEIVSGGVTQKVEPLTLLDSHLRYK